MGEARLVPGLEALAERWRLPAGSVSALAALVGLVADDDRAPTTVRDPERVRDDHLADSLVALELDEVRSAAQIADLGSGAGFPGLPLAIALPDAQVSLVEANARKSAFLRRAIAAAEIANATVVNARAEQWTAGLVGQDLVTARALAPLSVLAEYAAPLLRIGGALVAWRGRRDADAERGAAAAAGELGLSVAKPRRVTPYRGAQHRYLHVMVKTSETPPRFPRRAGVALKHPLGAGRRARIADAESAPPTCCERLVTTPPPTACGGSLP